MICPVEEEIVPVKSYSKPKTMEAKTETFQLQVSFLPLDVTKRDMEQLFARFGAIEHIAIARGTAFVHFKDAIQADDAQSTLHDHLFEGRRIKVTKALKKIHQTHQNGCIICAEDGHWARDCPQNKQKGLDVKSGKVQNTNNSASSAETSVILQSSVVLSNNRP
jgi:RNA recognition motif-containing protein